jgi:8-oxo-dGTP pyrophosphatase MutT (NUDIX family)
MVFFRKKNRKCLFPTERGNSLMKVTAAPTARFALNLMMDRGDRLLLLRRSDNATLGPGTWGLPAGKIEENETPNEAALREMEEEIGFGHQITLQRYLGPIRDTYYGGQYELHLFHYSWLKGIVKLNEEHTAFAWVSKEEIKNYDVMHGIEEDIALLSLWPAKYLNPKRIPKAASSKD